MTRLRQGASKYYNKKTVVDCIVFHSAREATRYVELKIMEKQGLIVDLKLQPKFILQEAFTKNGIKYRAITYKADFEYKTLDKWIIEDSKCLYLRKNPLFKIKQKLFEYKFPHLHLELV